MKTIISGSRYISDHEVFAFAMEQAAAEGIKPSFILEGGEPNGIDYLANRHAKLNAIPYKTCAADWTKFRRAAGPIRNREMLEEQPTALIAVWDGRIKGCGTYDMIEAAKEKGLKVFVLLWPLDTKGRKS